MKNKKSQHEIAGFVMIVVVVAVIGIIFLSFTIGRGEVSKETSLEIENLLGAIMYRTSDCAVSFIPQYLDIEDLIKSCYENSFNKCLDGRTGCDVLKEDLEEIIEKSLDIGEDKVNKGYEIKIEYVDFGVGEEAGVKIIPFIKKGELDECEVKTGASRSVDVGFGSGVIDVELEVCRG